MSALQHAAASIEVASFLACCDDVVGKGTQTLSVSSVCRRLFHLEEEWSAVTAARQLHFTVSARMQALQHYCDVYDICARTVPLPQSMWDRWLKSLTTSFNSSDASEEPQVRLEALREELIRKYWGLYCRVHWGCACAVKPRLALVAEEAGAAVSSANAAASQRSDAGNTIATNTYTVEELERTLAAPLHAFAKLAHDMSHLFGDYAVVGAVERQWLNEDVLECFGDAAESSIEALVRRSYKRDVQVPSASLSTLLQEYEENEVDERKGKAIVEAGKATLKSPWMQAAVTLHQHLLSLAGSPSDTFDYSTGVPHKLLYDSKAYELLEGLLKELRKVPHGRGSLSALGLLTHRIVEWQHLSSSPLSTFTVADRYEVGVNSSQTQFYLFLLHQWFARYVASLHRWSVADMFSAADDSDLWSFVLDRHSFCLMWALTTFDADNISHDHTSMRTRQERLNAFRTSMDSKIDKLRAIFYSVAHCLQLYRRSVLTYTNPEKRVVRLSAAREAVHSWMTRVGVSIFCRGLLGDLLDTAEEWEDSNVQAPSLQLWALSAEAELKLIMYDTMLLLDCPNNTTERLETLAHVALDLCSSWKERLVEHQQQVAGDEEVPSISSSLFESVVALVVRIIQRIRVALQRSCQSSSELSSTNTELYLELVDWIKKLVAVAGAYVKPEYMNTLWDEYMFLISLPTPMDSAESDDAASSLAGALPGFMGYTSVTTKRAFGAPSPAGGGLDDICWERRNAFKFRWNEEEAKKKRQKVLAQQQATNTTQTNDADGMDSEAPAKRPRSE